MGELLPLPAPQSPVLVKTAGRECWVRPVRSYYSAADMEAYAKANLAAVQSSPEVSEAEVERALESIEGLRDELAQWCEAYPTDLFPEPDPAALKWLHDTRPGLCDEISAKMGRHMVARIRPMLDNLRAALTAARGGSERDNPPT